jgi:Fanconi anemia group M protein
VCYEHGISTAIHGEEMNFTASWTCTQCKQTFRDTVNNVKEKGHVACGAPYEKLTHKPVAIFDSREQRSGVPALCEGMGCEVIIIPNLLVGDSIVSDRTAFERKTAPDLLQDWLETRQLFSKLYDLKMAYRNPILLFEGYTSELFEARGIEPVKVQACLFTIAKMGIPLIETINPKGTAIAIKWMAEKEQLEDKRLPALHGKRSHLNPMQQLEYVISSLADCNVGRDTSVALLSHFGSIEAITTASVEELDNVPGIGKPTAIKIREIMSRKYEVKK